jgi:tRNA(fMet)-specific endonuclease VapC
MSFLLDTNILSAHIRRPAGLAHRFTQHSGRLYISTVSLAELYVWAYRRGDTTAALAAIDTTMQYEVQVLLFDADCARAFGQIRADLQRRGRDSYPVDLMIAAVAIVHDLVLVTHNTTDFRNVPDLRLEDWLVR